MKILGNRVMIKKLDEAKKTEGGLLMNEDPDELPRAVVVLKDESLTVINEGDEVYYVEPREKGKCVYNGEPHFILPIGSIVAVI